MNYIGKYHGPKWRALGEHLPDCAHTNPIWRITRDSRIVCSAGWVKTARARKVIYVFED